MLSMRKKSVYYDNQLLPFEEFTIIGMDELKEFLQSYEDHKTFGYSTYIINNIDDILIFIDMVNKSDVELDYSVDQLNTFFNYANTWNKKGFVSAIKFCCGINTFNDLEKIYIFYSHIWCNTFHVDINVFNELVTYLEENIYDYTEIIPNYPTINIYY